MKIKISIFIGLLLSGCTKPELPIIENNFEYDRQYYLDFYGAASVYGQIDKEFVESIDRVTKLHPKLIVTSKGGISQEAIKAAHMIRDRKIDLLVLGECSSACAELLLPAANTVKLIEEPLISFHGNVLSRRNLIGKHKGHEQFHCSYVHANDIVNFYEKTDVRADFWKVQYKYLKLINVEFREIKLGKHTCLMADEEFENTSWYPNSRQLRDLYGIEFDGKLCADSNKCYKNWLSHNGISGESYAVGSDIFRKK